MFIILVIPFLMAGCAAFLVCAAIPLLRRFALSTSVWCVAGVPSLFAFFGAVVMMHSGLSVLYSFLHWDTGTGLASAGILGSGWLPRTLAILVTVAGATAVTLAHGVVVRRFTLLLFRLYLTAVSFVVGALTVFFLNFLPQGRPNSLVLIFMTNIVGLALAAGLASICYRNASQFRGSYPQRFPVVTLEEFGAVEKTAT